MPVLSSQVLVRLLQRGDGGNMSSKISRDQQRQLPARGPPAILERMNYGMNDDDDSDDAVVVCYLLLLHLFAWAFDIYLY